MPKSQTAWSNTAKNSSPWVGVGKSGSAWVGNNTKSVTAYTTTGRTASSWSSGAVVQTPYLYDSSTITYDNAYSYDYLVPVANQTGNKNATGWTS